MKKTLWFIMITLFSTSLLAKDKYEPTPIQDWVKGYLISEKAKNTDYLSWSDAASKEHHVNWDDYALSDTKRDMVQEGYTYQMSGKTLINLNTKPSYKTPDQRIDDGLWNVTLYGQRDGMTQVFTEMSSFSEEPLVDLPNELKRNGYQVKAIKCLKEPDDQGNTLYTIQKTGYRKAWLLDSWVCDTRGCRNSLNLYYTKSQTDDVECFNGKD